MCCFLIQNSAFKNKPLSMIRQTQDKLANFRFLGSGGSLGVPVIACDCLVCSSSNKNNQRLRSASLIRYEGKNILIDVGPDIRLQCISHRIDRVDALLITHPHNDHVAGIDDLRALCFRSQKKLPCYMSKSTYEDLKQRYFYLFSSRSPFEVHLLEEDEGSFKLFQREIAYTTFYQRDMRVNGYRVGSLAYLSDIKEYRESIFSFLNEIKVLILSALRFDSSPLHFSVAEAIAFFQKTAADKLYLTHISHDLEHERLSKSLPKNVLVAYDGLEFSFPLTTPYQKDSRA